MGLPWAIHGHQVYCFNADGADHGPYDKFHARYIHEGLHYVNAWIDVNFMNAAVAGIYGKPDIIFAFPPCTDMAVSGASAFESKRKKDPLFQEKAAFTAMIASRIADHFNIPYIVENPVSVLSTFWRKPDYIYLTRGNMVVIYLKMTFILSFLSILIHEMLTLRKHVYGQVTVLLCQKRKLSRLKKVIQTNILN